MTTINQTEFKDAVKARTRIEEVVSEDGHTLKREGKNHICGCMFHAEKSASFKIDIEGQYWKCFGCGKGGDVFEYVMLSKRIEFTAALEYLAKRAGMTLVAKTSKGAVQGKNPLPAQRNAAKPAMPAKVYTREKLHACIGFLARDKFKDGKTTIFEYLNPTTAVIDLIVARIDFFSEEKRTLDKRFYQAHPVEGGFEFGGVKTDKNPIFNLMRVAGDKCIVIVEGEKKVVALAALGITATCSPGGAQSASKADWTPLAGKSVIVWPDHDIPGAKYSADVIIELEKLNPRPSISMIDPSTLGLDNGGDVCDFIAGVAGDEQAQAFEVAEVLGAARPIGPLAELRAEIDDAISGRRAAIPFTWPETSHATKAFLPGSVTILCGGPGATKSLSLIQNLAYWNKSGVRCVALMLEDGSTYHRRRCAAQITGKSCFTNDSWCKEHPDEATAIFNAAKGELQGLAPCIESPSNAESYTVDFMLEWIREKCEAGNRIVCIDPITLMQKGRFGFEDDLRFMIGAKRLMEKHRASLLLITHPRKSPAMQRSGAESLSDLAGGAAYERFAHCILYLKSHEPKDALVKTTLGRTKYPSNRTLLILKARNSFGAGERLALWFDTSTLTLQERGAIVKDEKL